jgi:transcriptional regulator with XRE-family HTH domain
LRWFGKSSTFAAKLKIYNMKTKVRLKKDVGIVLRGLRHQKSVEADVKLTQSDIANDSGLSLRYYNKLENGLAIPTIDVLLKIANIYDMTLSDLCKLIEDC